MSIRGVNVCRLLSTGIVVGVSVFWGLFWVFSFLCILFGEFLLWYVEVGRFVIFVLRCGYLGKIFFESFMMFCVGISFIFML